jgi:hypothetical protein
MDNHNNVMVQMEEGVQPFNVAQVDKAPTPHPQDRGPPTYYKGSLQYNDEPESQESLTTKNKSDSETAQPQRNDQALEQEKKKAQAERKTTKKKPTESDRKTLSTGGRERQYSIIRDNWLGQYYAAELIIEEGMQKAHLYKKAKKRNYHPVWYDPKDTSDPPRSKAQLTKPKGWLPWTIQYDQDKSWNLIPPMVNKLSQLEHSLIK